MGYSTTVTAATVIAEAPFNANQVDATSEPVSTANLTTWVGEAEGILASLADANGITIDDAATVKEADRGVKAFAIAQALRAMLLPDSAAPYWDEWLAARTMVENRSSSLGDDYDAASGLPTNVDTSDPKKRRWSAYNSDRGDGWTGW